MVKARFDDASANVFVTFANAQGAQRISFPSEMLDEVVRALASLRTVSAVENHLAQHQLGMKV